MRSRKARYSVTDVYITEATVTLMSYEGYKEKEISKEFFFDILNQG